MPPLSPPNDSPRDTAPPPPPFPPPSGAGAGAGDADAAGLGSDGHHAAGNGHLPHLSNGSGNGNGHPAPSDGSPEEQTLWGLSVAQLHDRFWAARGVQVVRQGERVPLERDAELYLLTDSRCFCVFRLGPLVDRLSWLKPRVAFVRLHSNNEQAYEERIITDEEDRFLRFERRYNHSDWRAARVALTPHLDVAEFWQETRDARTGWRQLRRRIKKGDRFTTSEDASVYHRDDEEEVRHFIRELVQVWRRPDATVQRAHRRGEGVWVDREGQPPEETRITGPVWIGSGRDLDRVESVVGPAVLWDAPEQRPRVEHLAWKSIVPTDVMAGPIQPRKLPSWQRGIKRAFDIAFASTVLIGAGLTVWVPIMWMIKRHDGGPIFFGHRREGRNAREFDCLKFRTMRTDAEEMKAELAELNQVDGPQFFIENDPRHTKIGKKLRKLNLDELPQFWNVLKGEMSVVGPRPSPHKENQRCPPWREARLSVLPGVTGLWQLERTRKQHLDFQEWVRYDTFYVENQSWWLDMKILVRTMLMVAGLPHGKKHDFSDDPRPPATILPEVEDAG